MRLFQQDFSKKSVSQNRLFRNLRFRWRLPHSSGERDGQGAFPPGLVEQRQHAVEEQVFRQVPLDVFADGLQGGESPFQGAVVRLQVQITGKAIVSLVELAACYHGDTIGAIVPGRVLEAALILSVLPFSLVELFSRNKPVGLLFRLVPVGNVVQYKEGAVLLVRECPAPRRDPKGCRLGGKGRECGLPAWRRVFPTRPDAGPGAGNRPGRQTAGAGRPCRSPG